MPDRALAEQLDQAIESMLAAAPPTEGGVTAGNTELAALVEVAGVLRDLPSEDFKAKLKTELQRRISMISVTTSTASPVAGVREALRTVTPFLIHDNAPGLVE